MEEKQLFTNLHKSKSCRQTDNELAKRIQPTTARNFINTANALHPNCHFAGIIFVMWNSSTSLDNPKCLGMSATWMGSEAL